MRKQTKKTTITVRGRVNTVIYANSRFSAGRLITSSGDEIKFVGSLYARKQDHVVLHGHWETDPKYGHQFKVETMEYDQELDTDGLASYLANHPDIKGVGPVKARLIAEQYGNDFERAITENPEVVAQAAGLPVETIHRLSTEWHKTRETNKINTWLAAFGLTHHQRTSLVKKFGNSVLGLLKADPYIIVREVRGFGFKIVDKIARKMGTDKAAPARIRAGIFHCVSTALEKGDCWVEYEDLIDRANTLLVMDVLDSRDRIERTLSSLIDENVLSISAHGDRFLVARPDIRKMEDDLAAVLLKGATANPHISEGFDLSGLMEKVVPTLNEKQCTAVREAISKSITLITGGAGSGKTFTVSAITKIYEELDLHVTLTAPTGKAAKRLEEVVCREASTIHRLLGFNGKEFARGPEDPLDTDVVIVDEVSMVDIPLAWQLFQAIDLDRTAVVLVGDHNQLPPVGPGNILRDLIQTRIVPTVVLDKVVRQAGVLKENSTAILRGEVHKTSEPEGSGRRPWYLLDKFIDKSDVQRFILEMFENVLFDRLGFDLVNDVQVLTPTHKGPLGTRELNIELQRLIQKKLWGIEVPDVPPKRKPKFFIHDKVIQTRNNYELGVMNGTVGIVTNIARDGTHIIDFDGVPVEIKSGSRNLQDIQLAYALTIHKSQGSEFPCAVVVVHKAHSYMHNRNLFYTGITRAKETVVVIGDRRGISNCVKKCHVDQRKTFLSLFLAEEAEAKTA